MSHYETHLFSMNLESALKEFNHVDINSIEELNKHYKFLAKKRHPDVGGSNSDFQKLSSAHNFLTNHLNIYKTTKVTKRYKKYQSDFKTKQDHPSLYDCDPFIQKFNLKIKLIFLFCFIAGVKVKTINKITYVFFKKKTVIFSRKEAYLNSYSTRINNKRVSFYNNKTSKIDNNLFVRFI